MRGDIDAKDADRRFFRNIRLVLIAPLVLAIYKWRCDVLPVHVPVAVAIMLLLASLRYHDQDGKFTKLLVESLIVLSLDSKSDSDHNVEVTMPTKADTDTD